MCCTLSFSCVFAASKVVAYRAGVGNRWVLYTVSELATIESSMIPGQSSFFFTHPVVIFPTWLFTGFDIPLYLVSTA